MKIAYFLEDTELAGGTRVAVAHGDALTDRGHEITLVTRGGPLTWRNSRATWLRVDRFVDFDARPYDFIVGTFWTTLHDVHALAGDRGVHFCQGYEGSFTAYQPLKPRIDEAYRLPLPKITVSPHLVPICREFYDDAAWVGQMVDDEFYQPHSPRAGKPRVLLVGPAQADFKGIDIGYDAVRRARESGADFDLIRVSQWNRAEDEPAELADEFHVAIDTTAMARLIASCDVFLGPSRREEGFGLPAAEAMASGVPAILAEIPSFLSWEERHDYALFAPEGDGPAMGEHLTRLLSDAETQARLSSRGRAVVEQFRGANTVARLERWFEERRQRITA
ncbi:MAG TPA: glycosyltransferase family 4 protein [Thermoanaerobaculia bacterium]|nr:glycosyltransferase family 4 protein [Thermoanaerobaculia bacterium]